MKTSFDYRKQSREALQGKWGPAVLSSVIYSFIAGSTSFLVVTLFLACPLEVGYYNALRRNLSGEDDMLGNMFRIGFKENYFRNLLGVLLMSLFILLWCLLLIVPGIIMSFAYAMTPFILADEPSLTVTEAIARSRAMMRGHKWQLFCLQFSFIGWALLCILSLGIGFFWLQPYVVGATAAFYEDLKAENNK